MENLNIDFWDQIFIDWEEGITEREDTYISTEKEHGKYYLGVPRYLPGNENILLEISVSTRTFLLYPFHEITTYLSLHSIYPHRFIEYCDIIQLQIMDHGVYCCIIKTYWLRLIQRTWKGLFKKKREYINKITAIENLNIRTIDGKFKRDIGTPPTIRGLLSIYSNVSKYKN